MEEYLLLLWELLFHAQVMVILLGLHLSFDLLGWFLLHVLWLSHGTMILFGKARKHFPKKLHKSHYKRASFLLGAIPLS